MRSIGGGLLAARRLLPAAAARATALADPPRDPVGDRILAPTAGQQDATPTTG